MASIEETANKLRELRLVEENNSDPVYNSINNFSNLQLCNNNTQIASLNGIQQKLGTIIEQHALGRMKIDQANIAKLKETKRGVDELYESYKYVKTHEAEIFESASCLADRMLCNKWLTELERDHFVKPTMNIWNAIQPLIKSLSHTGESKEVLVNQTAMTSFQSGEIVSSSPIEKME